MSVPFDDRGLLLGDGLFETVLADRGELVLFEAHVARMARGCGRLGLPAPDAAALREAAEAALGSAGLEAGRAAVRLTWTAGSGGRGLDRPATLKPRPIATVAPSPKPATPVSVAIATTRRNEASPASRLKTLSYLDNIFARIEAREAGADEALMLNTRGELACAGAANLFWIEGEALFTPALDCGVLDGVIRGVVMERARGMGATVVEAHEPPERLAQAQALFLTNSLIGMRFVDRLAERAFQPHPLVERLAAACADVC